MKVQEDETGLDLPATHLECIEDDEIWALSDLGYGTPDNPVTSLDGILCPNADEDEDHPIELVHVSDTPVVSPDAVKKENVLAGNPWEGLSDFDDEQYHYGNQRFEYRLEES